MKKSIVFGGLALFFGAIFIAACGSGSQPSGQNPIQGKVIKSAAAGNNLTVTVSNDTGSLKTGEQEFWLAFTDPSGKAVDVGSASFNNHMAAMGSMEAMNDAATLTTTSVPGVYKAKIKVSMAGEWQGQVKYEGPAGNGSATLSLSAH